MKKCLNTNGRVEGRHVIFAHVIIRKREITNGSVVTGVNVLCESLVSQGVVEGSVNVFQERKGADSIVIAAIRVVWKCRIPVGYVLKPREIAQHRCSANR